MADSRTSNTCIGLSGGMDGIVPVSLLPLSTTSMAIGRLITHSGTVPEMPNPTSTSESIDGSHGSVPGLDVPVARATAAEAYVGTESDELWFTCHSTGQPSAGHT